MLKKILLPASFLFLCSCSDPKETIIPSDPKQWDTIGPAITKLNPDDQREIRAYMQRIIDSSANAIPPGLTIEAAIKEQITYEQEEAARQKKEKQVAQEEELSAQKAREQAAALEKEKADQIRQAVAVNLVDAVFLPKDFRSERYDDRINFVVVVQNTSDKAISGILGYFIFKDQFNQEIKKANLEINYDISPKGNRVFSEYYLKLNEFEHSDQQLASTDFKKIKTTFIVTKINFSDGTSLSSSD